MRNVIVIVCLVLLLFVPSRVNAKTVSGDTVTVARNEVIDDDLFISGGEVKVLGTVKGDVYAAGGDVTVDGMVDGDVLAAGGSVNISGEIRNNVRAAGGKVSITDAKVGRNVTVFSGDVSVSDSTIIAGRLHKFVPEKKDSQAPIFGINGSFSILSFLSSMLVGSLLLKFVKPVADQVTSEMRRKPSHSLMTGFIALFAAPIIALLLVFTIIGIPLAVMIVVLCAIEIYLSKVFVAIYVGEYVNDRFALKSNQVYLNFAVGLLLIEICMLLPVIRSFVGILVLLLGFGSMVRVKKEYLFPEKK